MLFAKAKLQKAIYTTRAVDLVLAAKLALSSTPLESSSLSDAVPVTKLRYNCYALSSFACSNRHSRNCPNGPASPTRDPCPCPRPVGSCSLASPRPYVCSDLPLKVAGDKGLLSCRKLAARLWVLSFAKPWLALVLFRSASAAPPTHSCTQIPQIPYTCGRTTSLLKKRLPFPAAALVARSPRHSPRSVPAKSCRWPSFRNRPSFSSLSTPSASCPSSGCVSYSRARSSPSTRASDPLPSFPSFLWRARKFGRLTLRAGE